MSNVWTDGEWTCDAYAVAFGIAIPHIVIDTILLALAVLWIWQSPRIQLHQKRVLSGIFALGIL